VHFEKEITAHIRMDRKTMAAIEWRDAKRLAFALEEGGGSEANWTIK